jgi:hypothetical protein
LWLVPFVVKREDIRLVSPNSFYRTGTQPCMWQGLV